MNHEWRKSSRSDHQGSCVEVRADLAALRDSKNVVGPSLAGDVRALVLYARLTSR